MGYNGRRYGRITDPRHIDGPSLDPPEDPWQCEECEEWCHTEGTEERGSTDCVCQTGHDNHGDECDLCSGRVECPECEGEGRHICDCDCHRVPDEGPDRRDEG